jgi:hypothetical protein
MHVKGHPVPLTVILLQRGWGLLGGPFDIALSSNGRVRSESIHKRPQPVPHTSLQGFGSDQTP